jgi:hypothetical protein
MKVESNAVRTVRIGAQACAPHLKAVGGLQIAFGAQVRNFLYICKIRNFMQQKSHKVVSLL